MANSESQFRTELKETLEADGTHAVTVIAQRYMVGVHDLQITGRLFIGYIELKFERAPKNIETKIKVNLSDKQREFGREQQKCGGKAAWMLCVRYKRHWSYFFSSDFGVTHVDQREFTSQRVIGGKHDFDFIADYQPPPVA